MTSALARSGLVLAAGLRLSFTPGARNLGRCAGLAVAALLLLRLAGLG